MNTRSTHRLLSAVLVIAAALSAVLTGPALATHYVIHDLGTLGGAESKAYGINSHGAVVGYSKIPGSSFPRAFLWEDGVMTNLGAMDMGYFTGSEARDINDSGRVVGFTYDSYYKQQAVSWNAPNQLAMLGSLGGTNNFSIAEAISNAGVIVGSSGDHNMGEHAVAWRPGRSIQDLGTISYKGNSRALDVTEQGHMVGMAQVYYQKDRAMFRQDLDGYNGNMVTLPGTTATGISDLGYVVGYGETQDYETHAFLMSDPYTTEQTDLGTLGGEDSYARAVNDFGHVVGDSLNADNIQLAFVYRNGDQGIQDLNSLIDPASGWTLTEACDINNLGQIVGYGTKDGQVRAFLLDPPGASQDHPLLPETLDNGQYEFPEAPSGAWIDPPAASGFTYTMITPGALFTRILDFPTGFDAPFTVTAEGTVLGEDLAPGDVLDFTALLGHGVTEFTLSGIDPTVDSEDPAAFPLQVEFNVLHANLTMTAIAVPEPGALTLLFVGLAVLAASRSAGTHRGTSRES